MPLHPSPKFVWRTAEVLLCIGSGGVALACLLLFIEPGDGESLPRGAIFLGRFHPMVLHFPIGFVGIVAFLDVWSWRMPESPGKAIVQQLTAYSLSLATISTAVAVVAGWLLSYSGGYGETLLQRHFNAGLGTLTLLSVALICRARSLEGSALSFFRKTSSAVFGAACLSIAAAGHYGAAITHGESYLIEYAPNPIRIAMGLSPYRSPAEIAATPISERRAFADVVFPVLEARCTACHNQGKLKGELNLTDFAALLRGGDGGPVVRSGFPEESELLLRVHRPLDDEKHMPPQGKPQLTDDEVTLLTWWVAAGIPEEEPMGILDVSGDVIAALERQIPDEVRQQRADEQRRQAERLEQSLVALRRKVPGKLTFIVAGEPALSFAVGSRYAHFEDRHLHLLTEAAEHLRWMDLRSVPITEEGATAFLELTSLQRLSLQGAPVGDAIIRLVSALPEIEILNLYGTRLTDAGLEHLAKMPHLKTLYVSNTAVTEEGVRRLRAEAPDLEIFDDTASNSAVPVIVAAREGASEDEDL